MSDRARRVRIKICCISSVAEAAMAVDAGVDALGLVSAMPSGPGVISEAMIAEIVTTIPPGVESFLLTSRTTARDIAAQHARCATTTIQLVDHVAVSELESLRAALPTVTLVQVIHVRTGESVTDALAAAPYVDALLLDSGNPTLATKELGGTGRVHDWAVSAEIVAASLVPVYLAGGLHAGNATAALAAVRPYGLDICSGVRTNGALDAQKLSAFVGAVRRDVSRRPSD